MAAERRSVLERFRLDGDVAIIVGGASGIGRMAAEVMAEVGAIVVVADLDHAKAEQVSGEIGEAGGRAEAAHLDVRDPESCHAMVEAVTARHGRLGVLVNSAGLGARRPAEELPAEDWRRVVDVNLTGSFFAAQAAARAMLRGGHGSIINVSSIMGLTGGGLYPNAAYHATKGAIVNLTRALAVEWADRGVRVNALAPTFVRTPLTAPLLGDEVMLRRIEARTPMGRIAEPMDLAGAFLFLASPASAMVTGQTIPVDGGWTAA